MKYLLINSVCGIRSTGRICTDIAEALIEQGNEVKIAYGREMVPDKYQKYAVRIGSDFSTKMHGIRARFFDEAGFGSDKETKKFIAWVKQYNPDIIHIHNLHGYYINVGILFDYLKESQKTVVWTLHDCWAFTGHCPYFEFVGCEKWKGSCGNCPQNKEYPKSFFDFSKRNRKQKKKIFSNVPNMTLVTPSQWLANLVNQSFLGSYPIKVIHNCVDTSTFTHLEGGIKKQYHIENKKIVLGVASEWNYRKGLNYMIELSHKLGNEYVVVVIGVTEKQKKGFPSTMIGLSRTSNVQELAEWYSVADVFVNPTLEDNYPTTNLEAIACGTPVVTFDSGGSSESAKLYGTVVKKGDIEAMCEEIKTYNFQRISADLSLNNMTAQYLSLYKNLIKEESK